MKAVNFGLLYGMGAAKLPAQGIKYTKDYVAYIHTVWTLPTRGYACGFPRASVSGVYKNFCRSHRRHPIYQTVVMLWSPFGGRYSTSGGRYKYVQLSNSSHMCRYIKNGSAFILFSERPGLHLCGCVYCYYGT